MKELIDIFKMNELSKSDRAKLIIALGRSINFQYASNITEPIVFELVTILFPDHPILSDDDFLKRVYR